MCVVTVDEFMSLPFMCVSDHSHPLPPYSIRLYNKHAYQEIITEFEPKFDSNRDYWDDVATSRVKVAISEAMVQQYVDTRGKLAIVVNPAVSRCVRAIQVIKAGELKLVPASNNVYITNEHAQVPDMGVHVMDIGSRAVFIPPKVPAKPKAAPEGSKPAYEFIAPFWLVKSKSDPAACNMGWIQYSVKVGSEIVNVPCLVNTRQIEREEVLTVYVPFGCKSRCHIPADTE